MDRFFIGNRMSLSVEDLVPKMKEFYAANYSSERMTLCVVGRESLEELENLVNKHFEGIQCKHLP